MKLTAPRLLALRFLLEEILCSASSMSGKQFEQLRSHQIIRSNPCLRELEQKQIDFADLGLFTKELTREEESVCRFRYLGVGHFTTYYRLVRAEEVKRVHFNEGKDEILTAQGEEFVGFARTLEGNPIPGWLEVKGHRTRGMTYRQIADKLHLSYQRVRCANLSAHEKVTRAIQKRECKGVLLRKNQDRV